MILDGNGGRKRKKGAQSLRSLTEHFLLLKVKRVTELVTEKRS